MLRIVLTGAESSGKTTLTAQLAAHFKTAWTPEFSRLYLENLQRPYVQADLLKIAEEQLALEEKMAAQAHRVMFLDTSFEVLKIWSEVRYGECHPWILEQLRLRLPDLYLLCQPDLPWEFDPLRENPLDREALYLRYRQELATLGAPVFEVKGIGNERFEQAVQVVELLLKN
ncbi:MAG: ATP-binding protein [Bacteroidota bacterium]